MTKQSTNILKSKALLFFILVTVLLAGLALVNVYFFPSLPKSSSQKSSTNKSKELALKIENVYQKITPENTNIEYIIQIDDNQNSTPAQTLKKQQANTFELTFQSRYFIENITFNQDFIKKVLIHEFMHVLSLQNSQFQGFNQVDFQPINKSNYDLAQAKCEPNYFNTEGCLNENSYLSKFYKKFWTGDLKSEYNQIQSINDKQEFNQKLNDWGLKYKDNFVSRNAFSSVEEDLAESFSIWVLNYDTEKQTPIQKDKIHFFDDYPELKQIKEKYVPTFETIFGN
ncbi:MAG: hypothetical protein WCK98_07765 [bacterium]